MLQSYRKLLLGAGVLLSFVCVYQLFRLHQEAGYNAAMRAADYQTAAAHDSAFGEFSRGREMLLGGEYERAQQAFAAIDIENHNALRQPVLFELAHAYIGQAVAFEKKGDAEQRVPLLELAKENYRKILRDDPDNWAVRVNLARVLRMLPDARLLADDDEDVMPERSPQATVQTMGHDRLP